MPRSARSLLAAALTLVAVAGSLALPAAAAADDATGTIAGTAVVHSDLGPMNVCVSAYDTDRNWVALTVSNIDGAYTLDVPAGAYYVLFESQCWFGLPVAPELFPGVRSWDQAQAVEVTADGTTTVDADLEALTHVDARIVDQFGNPAECNVATTFVGPGALEIGGRSTSSYEGQVYFPAALGEPTWVWIDCGDGYDPLARIITATGDFETDSLGDVVVQQQARSVSGTLKASNHPLPHVNGACAVGITADKRFAGAAPVINGHWTLTNLPVGPVRVAFVPCRREEPFIRTGWYGGADFATATDIEVLADEAVSGIEASAEVNSMLLIEVPGYPEDGFCYWITDVAASVLVDAGYVYPGGTGAGYVLPGDYKVLITGCDPADPSRQQWYGGSDAASAAVVHVDEDYVIINQELPWVPADSTPPG